MPKRKGGETKRSGAAKEPRVAPTVAELRAATLTLLRKRAMGKTC